MDPTNSPAPDTKTFQVAGVSFLVLVQIVMLVVLNVFDYAYILPSRSGLTLGHELLFSGVYVVALVWGTIYALRRFHWAFGAAQIVVPVLLWVWLSIPQHYNPAKYQYLVGKTQAEVDSILGENGANGVGKDENGFCVHYNGMRVYYSIATDNSRGPETMIV